MPWSWVNTEYSIHQVPHTPSTPDTEYSIHRVQYPSKIACLPFIFMITSWPLNVALDSGVPPYIIDRHQPTQHVRSKFDLTDWWIETQCMACGPSAGSKYSSNLAQSRPWSVSLDSLNYGLQVCTIQASQCISKVARLGPPSSHCHGLHLNLQTHSIIIL